MLPCCWKNNSQSFSLILWNYLLKNLENLPPVSLIPVVHLELRIFEKTRNDPNANFKGIGEEELRKKTWSKISHDTVPLKRIEEEQERGRLCTLYFVLCTVFFVLCTLYLKVLLIYVDSLLDCCVHRGTYLQSHTEVPLLFQVSSADTQTKTDNDTREFFRWWLVFCYGPLPSVLEDSLWYSKKQRIKDYKRFSLFQC